MTEFQSTAVIRIAEVELPLMVNSGSSEAEIQRQLAVIQTARNVLVNVGYVAVRITFARPAVDQQQSYDILIWRSARGTKWFSRFEICSLQTGYRSKSQQRGIESGCLPFP